MIYKSAAGLRFLLSVFMLCLLSVTLSAAGDANEKDPVPVIMHHIMDSNEFHVATKDGHHISVPLPVIIYNTEKGGLDVFMSSKVAHGHEYLGYSMQEGRVKSIDGAKIIDLSITKNVFSMLLSMVVLTVVLIAVRAAYKKRPGKAPKGLQSFIEPVVDFINKEVIIPNVGPRYKRFQTFLLACFFFILCNNLIGIIPFFPFSANLSGNISFTFTLAFFAFLMINLNGNKHYWKHIFAMPGVPKPVLLILTPVEILGIFLKPMVLMLRLFGNISGGHIAILSIVSLIFILGDYGNNLVGAGAGSVMAFLILIFVNAMELLVAFLQAYVFTLLTAIFIGAAVAEDHHHAEEHH
jgi:F-type H+-transporting ATPase subunit a